MQETHLAIASIPLQPWENILDEKDALCRGTIFEDLDKPFFAAEAKQTVGTHSEAKSEEQKKREEMLTKITQVSFVLDDLTLFLDTHPSETEALSLYEEKSAERMELKKAFALEFYPLERDCYGYARKDGTFCWQSGPMPWEGACV